METDNLQLKPEHKKFSANMATLIVGTHEFSAGTSPILAGKIMLVNHDPHNLK